MLIIEDDDRSLKLARDILQVNGYRIIELKSGKVTLPMIEEHKPDLIPVDIHLPGTNGMEAVACSARNTRHAGDRVYGLGRERRAIMGVAPTVSFP